MKIELNLTEKQALALWAMTFEGHVLYLEAIEGTRQQDVAIRALKKFAKALDEKGMAEAYPLSGIHSWAAP
ncbi:MAG: hypothetical protein GY914_12090 [Prochlorococcus sp.]|nr:hypothetical protein [Prochlorococcus sp.]